MAHSVREENLNDSVISGTKLESVDEPREMLITGKPAEAKDKSANEVNVFRPNKSGNWVIGGCGRAKLGKVFRR